MVFLGTQDVWENADPGDDWIHVKTPAQAIALLETGKVSDLALEYELDCDKSDGTGLDVMKWIEKQVFTPPESITAYSEDKSVQEEMDAMIEKIKTQKEKNNA